MCMYHNPECRSDQSLLWSRTRREKEVHPPLPLPLLLPSHCQRQRNRRAASKSLTPRRTHPPQPRGSLCRQEGRKRVPQRTRIRPKTRPKTRRREEGRAKLFQIRRKGRKDPTYPLKQRLPLRLSLLKRRRWLLWTQKLLRQNRSWWVIITWLILAVLVAAVPKPPATRLSK